jgi:hypothetical protein
MRKLYLDSHDRKKFNMQEKANSWFSNNDYVYCIYNRLSI